MENVNSRVKFSLPSMLASSQVKLGPAVSSHVSPVLYLKSGAAGPDWSWLGKRHLVSAVCPPSLPPYLHLPQYLCLHFLQELQLIHMSVKYKRERQRERENVINIEC